MKKMLLIAAIISLLLSCGTEYYSVSIINKSSKTVTYDYNGSSDTLVESKTNVYKVKAYTPPPENIADIKGIASIRMDRKGDTFTFTEADKFTLNVINTLPVDIIIKADNYIDDNGESELTVAKNGGEDKDDDNESDEEADIKVYIYTSKPRFTSLTDYPVIFDWNLAEDEKTIYVIIR